MMDPINTTLDELLEAIDHDIAKNYHEETAEEPEYVLEDRAVLLNILRGLLDARDAEWQRALCGPNVTEFGAELFGPRTPAEAIIALEEDRKFYEELRKLAWKRGKEGKPFNG